MPGQGLSADAQRVADIISLQLSLAKYRQKNGRYPTSLIELFPGFAPVEDDKPLTSQPLDPTTHTPYDYRLIQGGSDYEIRAALTDGQLYAGAAHVAA